MIYDIDHLNNNYSLLSATQWRQFSILEDACSKAQKLSDDLNWQRHYLYALSMDLAIWRSVLGNIEEWHPPEKCL